MASPSPPEAAKPRRGPLLLGGGALALVVALAAWLILGGPRDGSSGEDPAATERLLQEARRLAAYGNVAGALAAVEKAKTSQPERAELYLLRAQLLEQSARFREARDEALAAHRLAPADPRVTLAALRYDMDFIRPGETEALAKQAIAQAPNNADAHLSLGAAIAHADDPARYPDALVAFQEANRLAPGSPGPLIAAGKLLYRMGDAARAVSSLDLAGRILDSAAARGPMSVDMLNGWIEQRRNAAFALAQAYRRLGRTAESRAASAVAARWSARASELRALRNRAGLSPPDPAARARLDLIARQGVAAWGPSSTGSRQ